MRYTTIVASLAATVAAVKVLKDKGERTFAVLNFQGGAVTEGRVDPIVNPGGPAGHVHTFQGASGISSTASGKSLKESSCSTANIEDDMSAYWAPSVYFHDRANNSFEKVKLNYMKVYYFFEPSDDDIKAFPTGLQILAGNASLKTPPATAKNVILNGLDDPIQPVQFTCPRSKESKESGPRLYPENSNGMSAGMGVLNSEQKESGEGAGFPGANCDGQYSPLRADIHFPSCYDPSKKLEDYQNNMAYPTDVKGKHNCPPGWIHVPHLFYELYWETPKFASRWTPGKDPQPFCLSNGDCKGYSLHADFLAAWDESTLQKIIDYCRTGNGGMDKCDDVIKKPEGAKCTVPNPFPETIDGTMKNLPGNNAWYDFNTQGAGSGSSDPKPSLDTKANPQPAAEVKPDPQPAAEVKPNPQPAVNVKAVPQPAANVNADSQPAADAQPEPKAQDVAQQPGAGGAKAVAAPAPSPTPAPGPSPVVTSWVTSWVTTFTTVTAPSNTVGADASRKQSVGPAGELEGWKHAGCFRDNANRVIIGDKFPKLDGVTNENCIKHCKTKGFTVAGTENGGQCFCGKEVADPEKLDQGECSSSCQGAPSSMCGGTWALTVYSANGSIKP